MKHDLLHTVNHGAEILHDWYNIFKSLYSYIPDRQINIQLDQRSGSNINIVIENSPVNVIHEGKRIKTDYYKWMKKVVDHKETSVVLVGTEAINGNRFDSQNRTDSNLSRRSYYDEDSKWALRFKLFAEATQYAKLILVPPLPKEQLNLYRQFETPVLRLPFIYPNNDKFCTQRLNKTTEKVYDFCFSGTITYHRSTIIQDLRNKGFTVAILDNMTSEYIRQDVYSKSWMIIAPLLDSQTKFMSLSRAKYILDHGYNHLFEMPLSLDSSDNDILKFVMKEKQETYLDKCISQVNKLKDANKQWYDNNDYVSNSKKIGKEFENQYKKIILT